jgi:hypothetical protein
VVNTSSLPAKVFTSSHATINPQFIANPVNAESKIQSAEITDHGNHLPNHACGQLVTRFINGYARFSTNNPNIPDHHLGITWCQRTITAQMGFIAYTYACLLTNASSPTQPQVRIIKKRKAPEIETIPRGKGLFLVRSSIKEGFDGFKQRWLAVNHTYQPFDQSQCHICHSTHKQHI